MYLTDCEWVLSLLEGRKVNSRQGGVCAPRNIELPSHHILGVKRARHTRSHSPSTFESGRERGKMTGTTPSSGGRPTVTSVKIPGGCLLITLEGWRDRDRRMMMMSWTL